MSHMIEGQKELPKTYNNLPAPQIGSMNILRSIPKNDAILISESGEQIQPIGQPKQPTGSVTGSVPSSYFPFLEFPLTEVVNQSQIDFSSISDMLDLREKQQFFKESLQEYRFLIEMDTKLWLK